MQIKHLAAALLGATMLSFSPVLAQAQTDAATTAAAAAPEKPLTAADLKPLQAELQSARKEVVAQTLLLTPDESTKFWPVYDQYIAELSKINDEKFALIAGYVNDFGKIGDKQATDFITRALAVDTKQDQLRSKYVPLIGKVLPGVKMATFFQIDRRLQMLGDLKVASSFPLLQAQAAAK